MAPKKHVHKYHKVVINGDKLWACALPDCTHYQPKHIERMVIGKKSICWQCEEQFTLNAANMLRDLPLCDDCSGVSNIIQRLEEIG